MKKTNMFRLITTEACNARCRYCLAKTTPKPGQAQPLEAVERAARLAAEHGATEAAVSGGEPLLDRQVMEKIRICARYFRQVNLQSNGTLARDAETLREAGVTHAIINIPSYDAKIYKQLVGLDALHLVKRNIIRLVNAGIVVRFNVVIVKDVNDSEQHTEQMMAFARKVGAREITFTELYPANDYAVENYRGLEHLRQKFRAEAEEELVRNETANVFRFKDMTVGVSACVRKFLRQDKEKDWIKEYVLTEDAKLVEDYFDQQNTQMEV